MSDLHGKFNHLNKSLQGKNLNLVIVKIKITSFSNQLELYGRNYKNNDFSQFASLKNLEFKISEGKVEVFLSHLEQLKIDIDKRFNDVFQLNVPKLIIEPFKADLFEVNVYLQTDLEVNFSKE